MEEHYKDGELIGTNIHEGEGHTEIHDNNGEESGKVIHMGERQKLQEELGRISLDLFNAQGEEKEKIEARIKELEKELGLKEAA